MSLTLPWRRKPGRAPVQQRPAGPTFERVTYEEFVDQVSALPTYDGLSRRIHRWAPVTLEAFFNGQTNRRPYIDVVQKAFLWQTAAQRLQLEWDRVNESERFVRSLFVRARSNGLRLRENTMAPETYGRQTRDSEMEEALRWIVSASTSLSSQEPEGHATVQQTLRRTMLLVIEQKDVRNAQTLVRLHQSCVRSDDVPKSRGISAERSVKYCSSGGAGYMQWLVHSLAMEMPEPPEGDPAWDQLACALLGGHLRAHGFTDGNGRAVRSLYACTLFKGGRPFVAPTREFEDSLSGL